MAEEQCWDCSATQCVLPAGAVVEHTADGLVLMGFPRFMSCSDEVVSGCQSALPRLDQAWHGAITGGQASH